MTFSLLTFHSCTPSGNIEYSTGAGLPCTDQSGCAGGILTGNYSFANDTIYGKGESIVIENVFEPFDGKISVNAVEEIELDEVNNTTEIPVLIVKTNEREFFFKSEESSYSVRNDTIYGKGISRLRNVKQQQFEVAISINDVQEIQLDKFNLGTTIVLASIVVLSVVLVIAAVNNPQSFITLWEQ